MATHPHHHLNIRKRIYKHHQPYPHPVPWMRWLDRFVTILGVVNVLATFPQAYQIYSTHEAAGVSVLTWGYYAFFGTTLLVYGIAHKATPIIITYTGSTILYILIAIGAIIY